MPFSKGDKNINRNGRPRNFDRFRSLALQIAHEIAKSKNGDPIYFDGRRITVAEAILRQWATSKEPRLQMKFIEVAFGNPPNKIELSGADGEPSVSVMIETIVTDAKKDQDRA